jgi:hypothetical protein
MKGITQPYNPFVIDPKTRKTVGFVVDHKNNITIDYDDYEAISEAIGQVEVDLAHIKDQLERAGLDEMKLEQLRAVDVSAIADEHRELNAAVERIQAAVDDQNNPWELSELNREAIALVLDAVPKHFNPDWIRAVTMALRLKGVLHQALTVRRAELRRKLNIGKRPKTIGDHLLQVAKRRLKEDLFQSLLEEARALKESEKKANP